MKAGASLSGVSYHTHTIQVCVMDQQRKILVNESIANDPEAVFRLVAPFGSMPLSKPAPALPTSPKHSLLTTNDTSNSPIPATFLAFGSPRLTNLIFT
jgi:hypothetical protein